jgi:hypothetical protein
MTGQPLLNIAGLTLEHFGDHRFGEDIGEQEE